MRGILKKLSLRGFKSIKQLDDFELRPLNVLIGANGAGKSNFVQLFRMLNAMADKNFAKFILERGGANNFLFNGRKITPKLELELEFNSRSAFSDGSNFYRAEFTPTVEDNFLLEETRQYAGHMPRSYGGPAEESRLQDEKNEPDKTGNFHGLGYFVYETIANWMVYHFHDTAASAAMRNYQIVEYCQRLSDDAGNIAPFLLNLKNSDRAARQDSYKSIVEVLRLVIPFFDDFRLDIRKFGQAEKVCLSWKQKGSDFPMQPYHLSDGSIRFMCLVCALLQPDPPSLIVIDEPELGLHPRALALLAELMQTAAQHTQIIVATQAPLLLDQFALDEIIVVKRENGASLFQRLEENEFSVWLQEYSPGELWRKNVIAGGVVYE